MMLFPIFLTCITLSVALDLEFENDVELPSIFERSQFKLCEGNHGLLESWCNTKVNPNLDCVMSTEFDQYGCSCHEHSSLCPSECADGSAADQKTHYGIQCSGIPEDEPNYVLKEKHERNHCENNALVASWCDDYVNKALSCSLFPDTDEYMCTCDKNPASCPVECIGEDATATKTHHTIICKGIPKDQPNYIIKGELKK